MKIHVKLFATLREGRGKELYPEFDHSPELEEVIKRLEIDMDQVSILLVNGQDATLKQTVGEDDTVAIFPPVGGG